LPPVLLNGNVFGVFIPIAWGMMTISIAKVYAKAHWVVIQGLHGFVSDYFSREE
jgi:hypothetical protein